MTSLNSSGAIAETFTRKAGRLAKRLAAMYLTHQSWKAHEGVFAPVPPEILPADYSQAGGRGRSRHLRRLTGVRLSAREAQAAWPRILEHKWYLSEWLGRDVGLRVAAVDYFENLEPPSRRLRFRAYADTLPPRLPMMMPFGERP